MQKKISDKVKQVGSLYEINWRHYFTNDESVAGFPELLEVQLDSYREFLKSWLDDAFNEIFPISDFTWERVDIFYKWFTLEEPKYSIAESRRKNLNYEAPLKIRLEMLNKETWEFKEQDIYIGWVPLMTETRSFIINGIERVIVSQIIRSTGIFFTQDDWDFSLKFIPARGSWFEISIEKRWIINIKIDKKRKLPVSIILRAFGLESNAEILDVFRDLWDDVIATNFTPTLEKDKTRNKVDALHAIYKLLRPGDLATDERVEELFNTTFFSEKRYDLGSIARMKIQKKLGIKTKYEDEGWQFLTLEDIVKSLKYFLNLRAGLEWYNVDDIDHLENRRLRSVWELVKDRIKVWLTRMEKIAKDRVTWAQDLDDATPGQFINGRPFTAIIREFFASSQLSQFMDQTNPLSEIAHKRRISALGPGWLTRERASFEVRDVHPTQYGRICPIATPEWPNIGLVLHLASYSKIDKYGFILTPYRLLKHSVKNDWKEAINRIALDDIVSDDGEVIVLDKSYISESQAKKIKESIKAKEIIVRGFLTLNYKYYDAHQERDLIIAEANSETDEYWNFLSTRLSTRVNSDPTLSFIKEVTHIDVSPKQIMSVDTSLIPFLEHDDATRAEMGTNMMRQRVPLVKPDSPIVWTGIERLIGEWSGYVIKAKDDGEVIWVDAKHITVLYKSWEKELYDLRVFKRSNHDELIHQRPRLSRWYKFVKDEILVDGQSIDNWELALGQNLVCAYMPWEWFNYEDAVVLSSRMVKDDVYTSIHIKEFILDVRETKLWAEQTTDDIPNVSIAKLKDLWPDGIIRIWAYVESWDILVWKITPKWEQELSPEERLLRAIFGDKSKDVKDSSLRLPGWEGWKVIHVDILKRELWDNLPTGVFKQVKVYVARTRKIEVWDKMAWRHWNKWVVARIVPVEDMPFMADGTPVDIVLNPLWVVSRMNIGQVLETHLWEAARRLGIKIATPILNWVPTEQISHLMEKTGMSPDGKIQLYDGKTWEPFQEKATVGINYMLKLHHLVEDKIHTRSVGPYSMVTQQPLGWKAQNGWQRFWEMEVWALEWYGAANVLQEMITIKSDDIVGRTQAYEAIVKWHKIRKPNIPESFNVLIKELQALALNIELLDDDELNQKQNDIKRRYEKILELEALADSESSVEDDDEITSND